MLHELAELTVLDEGDPNSFRVRAYESAAQSIKAHAIRPGEAVRRGAAEDRGRRQEHGREDPRADRDRKGREAGGAARQAPAGRGGAAAHPGPRPEGGQAAARRAGRRLDRRPAPRARRAQAARPEGVRREVRGEADPVAGAPRTARVDRAHADLGGAAAGAEDRRAPGRGAGRDARVDVRFAAPLLGDDRRRRHPGVGAPIRSASWTRWWRCRRSTRVLGRGASKTSIVTRRGTQVDVRVVAPAPARRGAALLHRVEGPQHQAAPARARPRVDAERVRAVRARGRQGHRQRDRGGDLPGARAWRSSRPCCARTRARSRPPRPARCPRPIGAAVRRLPPAHDRVGRRALVAGGDGRGGASRAATASWPSPITPRGRCRASAARRSSSSGRASAAMQAELGDKLKLLHGVELNIGPAGELDYDLEFRRVVRLVPGLGARPLRSRPRRADPPDRDRDAGPGGADDRPPVGAHDRRAPAHRAGLRPGVRGGRGDRHGAGGERRPAAPGPVGRGAAAGARAQRHVPAGPATRTRRASWSA